MAKASALCICKKCGESFKKEKTCRNSKEADAWEEWAKGTFEICGKCWYQEQKEEEEKKDLYVDIRFNNPSIDNVGKDLAFVFGGNSFPKKDDIKKLGGIWTDCYPDESVLKDLFSISFTPKKWVLYCSLEALNETIEKVKKIGTKINKVPSDVDVAMYFEIKNSGIRCDRKKQK